jgi:ubiquinone biosynthesis protein
VPATIIFSGMARLGLAATVSLRAVAIISILVAHVVALAALYIRCVSTARQKEFARQFGLSLPRLAERLGPVGIKIAQVASGRPDLLPLEITGPMSRLHDHVSPPSQFQINQQFQALFPGEPGRVMVAVNPTPIGTGSVAYVIWARASSGQELALKFIRPGVKAQIERDLYMFKWLIRRISRLSMFDGIPICETFELFSDLILRQCSMRAEARHLERFKKFAGNTLIVPTVYRDLSNDEVLAMEYVPIVRNFDSKQISQFEYERLSLELLDQVYGMIFIHGIVHGDLHPGNVGVDDEDRLVLVDFGLVAELRELERRQLRYLFFGLATGDAKLVSQVIIESSRGLPNAFDHEAFDLDVARLVRRWRGLKAGQFLVAGFTKQLFELQKRFALFGPPAFANAIWALAMYEGLIRARFPQLDFQARAVDVLMKPYSNTTLVERSKTA